MALAHWPRLWRTLNRLQPSQIWWRTRYLAERKLPPAWQETWLKPQFPHRMTDAPTATDFPSIPLFHRGAPSGPAAVANFNAGRFEHLQQTVQVDPLAPDWNTGGHSAGRLWQITWHYHEWAFTLAEATTAGDANAFEVLQRYLNDWFGRCRLSDVGGGHLAWNAFAIATRLTWWIRAWHQLGPDFLSHHKHFAQRWRESIIEQARFLASHLEWDLRANHLLRDAVGLAWAGRFFEGTEPARWLQLATEIAVHQAREQVCADGGHFERSPMYHLHVMEDFLSLALLVKDQAAVTTLRETWSRMADYLRWACHPDGEISLFNDAALHHVCEPQQMLSMSDELNLNSPSPFPAGGKLFGETGLAVWHGEPWSVLFDVGPIGPACQPGHAHADNLTLEMSCGGQRLVVDPGVFHYDNDAVRKENRSTAAHNTVCVNQTDSSEVWHIFRVGRRAETTLINADIRANGMMIAATHDGYRHLPGGPIHLRTVQVDPGIVTVIDSIDGEGPQHLSGGWLIDPRWTVEPMESGWKLHSHGQTVVVQVTVNQAVTLSCEERNYSPQFGVAIPTKRLTWTATSALPFDLQTTFGLKDES